MDSEKLAKVLALIDSASEGEAVAAVRAARQMLAKEGLSFRDIAAAARGRGATGRRGTPTDGGLFGAGFGHDVLQGQVRALQADLDILQVRFNDQLNTSQRWQQKAEELQRTIARHDADTRRMRQKLRPILEELWALRDLLSQIRSSQAPSG